MSVSVLPFTEDDGWLPSGVLVEHGDTIIDLRSISSITTWPGRTIVRTTGGTLEFLERLDNYQNYHLVRAWIDLVTQQTKRPR